MQNLIVSSKDAFGKWEIKSAIRLMSMGRTPKVPVSTVTSNDTGQDSISLDLDGRQEFEDESSPLRQKHDATTTDAAEAHKWALKAAATAQARETAELQNAHTSELQERVSATKQELESAFEERLADALRQAEVAQKQAATTTEKLEQEFADRLADALSDTEEEARAELEKARQAWQAGTEAVLASARKEWQADEAARSTATKKEFELKLARLRQQLDDASLNFDEMRKQTLDAAAADRAREIAELE